MFLINKTDGLILFVGGKFYDVYPDLTVYQVVNITGGCVFTTHNAVCKYVDNTSYKVLCNFVGMVGIYKMIGTEKIVIHRDGQSWFAGKRVVDGLMIHPEFVKQSTGYYHKGRRLFSATWVVKYVDCVAPLGKKTHLNIYAFKMKNGLYRERVYHQDGSCSYELETLIGQGNMVTYYANRRAVVITTDGYLIVDGCPVKKLGEHRVVDCLLIEYVDGRPVISDMNKV